MRQSRFTIAAVLVALVGLESSGQEFAGRVVGVHDGDTITVLHDKTPTKIRLYGVDAPELGQDFGSRAKQAVARLAFDQVVKVESRDTDRYGRTVAVVIPPDGRSLNAELIWQGMAWHFARYAPNDLDLARLQTEAKEARRGLWGDPRAVPPWEWRKPTPAGSASMMTGVVGNSKSKLYHSPNCRSVAAMKASNRVEFGSSAAAESAGYRRAGDCR